MIFLVWLWVLTSRFCGEINAELDHARVITADLPEDEETSAVGETPESWTTTATGR